MTATVDPKQTPPRGREQPLPEVGESSDTNVIGADRIINDGRVKRGRSRRRRQPPCPRSPRWQWVAARRTAGDWMSIVVGITKDTPLRSITPLYPAGLLGGVVVGSGKPLTP